MVLHHIFDIALHGGDTLEIVQFCRYGNGGDTLHAVGFDPDTVAVCDMCDGRVVFRVVAIEELPAIFLGIFPYGISVENVW
ncbi:hypothetical protein D1872_285570 [compost metagenome]